PPRRWIRPLPTPTGGEAGHRSATPRGIEQQTGCEGLQHTSSPSAHLSGTARAGATGGSDHGGGSRARAASAKAFRSWPVYRYSRRGGSGYRGVPGGQRESGESLRALGRAGGDRQRLIAAATRTLLDGGS